MRTQNYTEHILRAAKRPPGCILLSLGSHEPSVVEVLSKLCHSFCRSFVEDLQQTTSITVTSRLPLTNHLIFLHFGVECVCQVSRYKWWAQTSRNFICVIRLSSTLEHLESSARQVAGEVCGVTATEVSSVLCELCVLLRSVLAV